MGAAAPKPPLAIPHHSKLWGFLAFSHEFTSGANGMETEKALLVVGVTLAVVLLINAGILVNFLRSKSSGQLKAFGRAIQAVQNPFRRENESLSELRERVSKLENQASEESNNDS